jgi:hypothetical protein
MRKTFTFNLVLSCLVAGCSAAPQRPTPQAMTAENALAAVTPVTDCEWAAAARYDDGHSTVAALAERITGICGVEILNAERTFHLSPNDPDVKMDEFKQAIETVEHVRKSKAGGK